MNIKTHSCAIAGKPGTMVFNFGKTSTTGAMVDAGRDWKRTEQNIDIKAIDINEVPSKHNKGHL